MISPTYQYSYWQYLTLLAPIFNCFLVWSIIVKLAWMGMELVCPSRDIILLFVLMIIIGVILGLACAVNRWEIDYRVGSMIFVFSNSLCWTW